MNSFDVFVIKGFTVLNHTKRIPQILNLGVFILIGSKVWENLKSLLKGHFFSLGQFFVWEVCLIRAQIWAPPEIKSAPDCR